MHRTIVLMSNVSDNMYILQEMKNKNRSTYYTQYNLIFPLKVLNEEN